MKKNIYFPYILSGIIAGFIFIFFLLITKLSNSGIILSFISGILSFIATNLILSKFITISNDINNEKNIKDINEIIKSGKLKIDLIRKKSEPIKERKLKQDITELCNYAEKIYSDISSIKEDHTVIENFLNNYLDTIIDIIDRYNNVINKIIDISEKNDAILNVSKVITEIKDVFKKYHKNLLKDDISELNKNILILQKKLEFDKYIINDK